MNLKHLDHHFPDYVTYKNLGSNFFKSEIGERYHIAFFPKKLILAEKRYETHG